MSFRKKDEVNNETKTNESQKHQNSFQQKSHGKMRLHGKKKTTTTKERKRFVFYKLQQKYIDWVFQKFLKL